MAEQTEPVRRRVAPKLIHLLKGDLDWIVMKCLEKDRTRRHETANGVAADLKRHLGNEPVTARAPTTAYRLQKAWRRNRLIYCAGIAVSTALVAGVIVSCLKQLDQIAAANPEDTDKSKHLALVRLWSGRTNEYVGLCRKLLELAATSKDPTTQDRAAKACLAHPGLGPGMLEKAVTAGGQAVKLAAKDDGNLDWFLITATMADLRDGKAAAAEAGLNQILARPNEAPDRRRLALASRALARGQLGRRTDALADLAAVEESLPKFPRRPALSPLLFEPDLIAAQLLHDEAKELVATLPASPKP